MAIACDVKIHHDYKAASEISRLWHKSINEKSECKGTIYHAEIE